MSTEGAWPVDPATEVGLFRVEIGDANGVPHEPPDGKADFEFFSDAAIEALIAANPDSIEAAAAKALGIMGRNLIMQAQDIQVDDIRIKTVERAKLFIEHADRLMAGAVFGDANSAVSIVPLNIVQREARRRPRGTPTPFPGVM